MPHGLTRQQSKFRHLSRPTLSKCVCVHVPARWLAAGGAEGGLGGINFLPLSHLPQFFISVCLISLRESSRSSTDCLPTAIIRCSRTSYVLTTAGRTTRDEPAPAPSSTYQRRLRTSTSDHSAPSRAFITLPSPPDLHHDNVQQREHRCCCC